MLLAFVPSAKETREMLAELATATGLSRRFRADLLGVPEDVLRRWEDGTRAPNQATRRLISIVCEALAGRDGFEVTHLLAERAMRIAGDKSRPAEERAEALRSVPELADFQSRLGRQVMALAEENEAGEPLAA